ncbi:MAG TPA: hypothetical protein VFU05_15410 [Cyclobacteriaceae bacterium]|nr:hypothetical protein [Cyclobacteriaceae bacterium]
MKNSVKFSLLALSVAVITGVALTFCSPKSDKPADTQDTVKVDTATNPVDSTAQEAPQDSAAAQ